MSATLLAGQAPARYRSGGTGGPVVGGEQMRELFRPRGPPLTRAYALLNHPHEDSSLRARQKSLMSNIFSLTCWLFAQAQNALHGALQRE